MLFRSTEILFLIYAVSKSLADSAVMGHLRVFLFCPCEISIHFFGKNKLMLFFAVCDREVIKGVVDMHDLSDHAVCLLGDRAFGCVLTDRLYKFSKRSSGMDLI